MNPDALQAEKQRMRTRILAARAAMSPAQRHLDSLLLIGRATRHLRFLRARSVLAYAGFGDEVDTSSFLRAVLDSGKQLVLPRIVKEQSVLELYEVRDLENDLVAGVWGIPEPRPMADRLRTLRETEFVLTPGLAFDPAGNRLGYGKGYYDRLFGECPGTPPFRLALAFDCQLVDQVPAGVSDIPLDSIVTPNHEYSS